MILGAQFFTLRNFCKTTEGLDESLKKVADMGYKAVQLSGVCDYDANWMAERLKEYGLKCAITHTKYDKIIGDTDATIAFHKAMDCPVIGLGMIPCKREEFTPEVVEKFMNTIRPAAKKIKEAGLTFSYHNHDIEFAKTEGNEKTFLELMCETIPADEMAITLDTYWVQHGGGDPAAWIRKLDGRIRCIHFKDMLYYAPEANVRIATIGEGNMNYDSIIKACLDTGIEYGFVELDNCYGADPFECMKKSYDFLTKRYGLH